MRDHPQAGYGILRSVLDDEVALEVVMCHHERWDGEGYPNGLLAEAIPLSARIAALADSLDALTNARAHREAFSWDEAVGTILKEGGHFDPQLLDPFQEALPRLKEIRTEPPSTPDSEDG